VKDTFHGQPCAMSSLALQLLFVFRSLEVSLNLPKSPSFLRNDWHFETSKVKRNCNARRAEWTSTGPVGSNAGKLARGLLNVARDLSGHTMPRGPQVGEAQVAAAISSVDAVIVRDPAMLSASLMDWAPSPRFISASARGGCQVLARLTR
jgi:hypothetical protein